MNHVVLSALLPVMALIPGWSNNRIRLWLRAIYPCSLHNLTLFVRSQRTTAVPCQCIQLVAAFTQTGGY